MVRPERYSERLCGHFSACCQYAQVFQKGSKGSSYYLILVRKSGRRIVPYPNRSSFLITAGPTSTGRLRNSLSRNIHPGPGSSFTLLSGGFTGSQCCREGPVPGAWLSVGEAHYKEVPLLQQRLCSASWC